MHSTTVAPVDVALTYGKRAIRAYLFVCVVAAVGEAPDGGGFGSEGGGGEFKYLLRKRAQHQRLFY